MNRTRVTTAISAVLCAACASDLSAASITLDTSLWDGAAQLVTVKNTGLTTPEGPACDSGGDLYFSDHLNFSHTAGVIWKVPVVGPAAIYKQNLDVPCGMVFDSRNRLLYGGWYALSRVDDLATPAGVTVLAQGDTLLEVNDLTLCSDGGLFFTGDQWDQAGYVYYRSPAGALSKALSLPLPGPAFPNGVEYVEEKRLLYVCLSQLNVVRSYHVDAQMRANTPAQFATVTGPDGIAIDARGNVWVASSSGNRIAAYDSTGRSLGAILLDWGTTNCAFGGSGLQTLYITGGTAVVSLRLKVAGRRTNGALGTRPVVPGRGLRGNGSTKASGHSSADAGGRTLAVSGAVVGKTAHAAGVVAVCTPGIAGRPGLGVQIR
jgi:gluconolactonase